MLKLSIGDKVAVIRLAPMKERQATYNNQPKVYYDNPVRIISTGEETVWSHGSEPAQIKLDAAAQVGDTVTIEFLKLEVGGCYIFHTSEESIGSGAPLPEIQVNDDVDGITPALREWMDKVIKFKNDTEFDIDILKTRLDQIEKPVAKEAPKVNPTPNADGVIPF